MINFILKINFNKTNCNIFGKHWLNLLLKLFNLLQKLIKFKVSFIKFFRKISKVYCKCRFFVKLHSILCMLLLKFKIKGKIFCKIVKIFYKLYSIYCENWKVFKNISWNFCLNFLKILYELIVFLHLLNVLQNGLPFRV